MNFYFTMGVGVALLYLLAGRGGRKKGKGGGVYKSYKLAFLCEKKARLLLSLLGGGYFQSSFCYSQVIVSDAFCNV